MFYASYNKAHNCGIYKHHGTRFINYLYIKLVSLYKLLLIISHIQYKHQNDIICYF